MLLVKKAERSFLLFMKRLVCKSKHSQRKDCDDTRVDCSLDAHFSDFSRVSRETDRRKKELKKTRLH